jgi:valyl-tRNA synthetase
VPFVTEELWNKLPGTDGSIMKAVFPLDREGAQSFTSDTHAEEEMALIMGIINSIRNIRGEMNISPSLMLESVIQSPDENSRTLINRNQDLIINLAKLNKLIIRSSGDKPRGSATAVIGETIISVLLEGVIDFSKETARLEKEIGKLLTEIEKISNKLSNNDFVNKAPEHIIEKSRAQFQLLEEKKEKLTAQLDRIKSLSLE